ncbi:hypothetical protein TRFO_34531 [Tritrichomonas foetus]|uniref:Importin subunit beta-1/Transportin-1-like TPR repeats domain-containing protein n=1 Tax=Tritrichomonas foetus TaxID=1144522 RepID=A0A1J4JIZ6_9EUKA|nr:hypothetical protein TRFO_34531 [Tritrichomonas foetus]|eukprot:OHS99126.1 hypothetical protein TRFO_34531 [Tritrichomonas foetus]
MEQNFVQHLHNLLNPQGPNYQESFGLVESFKNSDINGFFTQMLAIFPNAATPPHLRQLAMILCYQSFPSSLEGLTQHPFQNFRPEIISQFLSASVQCFADELEPIRISAATLFSRIACIDILTNDQYGITKTLIQGFQAPQSEFAFDALCLVLTDIFDVSTLNDEELSVIMTSLFNYLSSMETSDKMKCQCLRVLRSIINNLGDVLSDDQNVQSLFTALFAMSQNPGTKTEAFRCWSEFTVNYYPMLEIVAQQIAQSSFIELTQENADRDTLINVCVFWESIAECELRKKAELHIIPQVCTSLIPLLFRISGNIPYEQCDDVEEYEPHIAAAAAMQSIVAASPEVSMPTLVSLMHQFANDSAFGAREASLNCLNFMLQFCDVSPILVESLTLIFQRLTDPSPRVRQTAIYCVHALLQAILTKGDDCPFASMIPQIGVKVMHLAANVMNLMNDEIAVSSTAASATADFIQFPGFPYAGRAMSLLLHSAMRGDLILSQSAFSALQSAVSNCPMNLLPPLMKALLEIMKTTIEGHQDFWIIHHICYLLQTLYIRLSGQIGDFVQMSWCLLEATFQQYPDEAVALLSPLSSLARAAGPAFGPYIQTAAEFLLQGLNTYDRDDAIPSASLGVSLLSDTFDLSPFSLKFLEALSKAVAHPEIPIESKRFAVDAIGDLAMKTPHVFIPIAQSVLDPVSQICTNIGDLITYKPDDDDDDFDVDDILCSFLNCMQKATTVLAQVQSPLAPKAGEVVNDILEDVGGMKEHGDKLLKVSVDAMAALIQAFPQQMKETFQDEPGFTIILREAHEAQISLSVLEMIAQFLA